MELAMAKRAKAKKNNVSIESYQIEVNGWEIYYHFGMAPKGIIEGVYWEGAHLILLGRLFSPTLENASKAKIEIAGDPQLDDHWQSKPTIISAKATGWMEIPRGDDSVTFNCSVPSHSLTYLALAAQSGKIRYASITGTKLKWRQGTISHLSLSTNKEDE